MSATATIAAPDAPATLDAPVAAADRHDSLDLLRGVAVLMIFTVNIRSMVQPFFAQGDPSLWTGTNDLAIDRALQFVVDGKWVAVFSVLFGAGLMLMADKAAAAGIKPSDRIVRRQMWLIAFGVVHAAFVWLGDILLVYGVTGLIAMPLLDRSSRTVALWAGGVLAVGVLIMFGLGQLLLAFPMEEAEGGFSMASMIADEVAAKAGGVGDQVTWRAGAAPLVIGNVLVAPLFVLPYMLVGVLGYRSGFLLARWPAWCYALIGAGLLAAAWAMDAWRVGAMGIWDAGGQASATLSYETLLTGFLWVGMVEGLLGGLGYAALVMGLVGLGLRVPPLSAAGRMAFTNYIACSLIGTTLAAGHGGGLMGELTLARSLMIVGALWVLILVWSPLWLRAFRYGPLEWAWRSLSYGAVQPMRRPKALTPNL